MRLAFHYLHTQDSGKTVREYLMLKNDVVIMHVHNTVTKVSYFHDPNTPIVCIFKALLFAVYNGENRYHVVAGIKMF